MSEIPFNSQLVANIGISMGDEGKGRIVYELIDDISQKHPKTPGATTVIKVNGGANSGHTASGLKLNLIPSGVAHPNIKCLMIGAGVVADPRKFWWEIKPLEHKGLQVQERLMIDERTQVSDLSHRFLDLACENYRKTVLNQASRGSTGRGITPAFADETNQWQIFFSAFKGPKDAFFEKFKQRLSRTVDIIQAVYKVPPDTWFTFFQHLSQIEIQANRSSLHNKIFAPEEFDFTAFQGKEPFTFNLDALLEVYWNAGTALKGQIKDIREALLKALSDKEYIIGEFGQSYWLDKRHGFSPNVTASHTFTPEFFLSAGIPLQPIHTIACCKAYDTKVGTHTFLTQIPDNHPLASQLKKLEQATTTGRERMVGWFDAVEKGDALRYAGFDDLVINKLDALTYQGNGQGGELLICIAYKTSDGTLIHHIPRDDNLRQTLQPVYKQLPGWSEPLSSIRHFYDLPENAQMYIVNLLKYTIDIAAAKSTLNRLPNLRYIGVGPNPGEIIQDVPSTEELVNNLSSG